MTAISTSAVDTLARARFAEVTIVKPDDFRDLTPSDLLIYCQNRLQSLDTEIKSRMSDQQKMIDMKSELNDCMAFLNRYQTGGVHTSMDEVNAMTDRLQAALAKFSDKNSPYYNESATAALESAIKIIRFSGDPSKEADDTFSQDELKSAINALSSVTAEFDSNAEMNMIQLQSKISQRQQAIQLTTNMMQSLDSQLSAIAQNVGK